MFLFSELKSIRVSSYVLYLLFKLDNTLQEMSREKIDC